MPYLLTQEHGRREQCSDVSMILKEPGGIKSRLRIQTGKKICTQARYSAKSGGNDQHLTEVREKRTSGEEIFLKKVNQKMKGNPLR